MSEKEKQSRIYRNTIFLYIQQILVMGAGFLTARVVLDVLGEEDYGVYNVICGFVMMFDLLSGAFSIAIGRFLTFELGWGNLERALVLDTAERARLGEGARAAFAPYSMQRCAERYLRLFRRVADCDNIRTF